MSASEQHHEHQHLHDGGQQHAHLHDQTHHDPAQHEMGTMGRQADYGGAETRDMRIPVSEEQLNVEKREAEIGEVQLRKTVTQEQQTVPVELTREEVRVERRDVGDRPLRPGEQAFEESTIRVPVRGEEAVVTKDAVVTGEVVLNKEQTTERQQVADTVRKERVEVDQDYERHRPAFQQHYAARQGQMADTQWGARTWEEAEPNYQYGYMAGRNQAYQGRQFEEVEPELRGGWRGAADYAQGGADTGYQERTGQSQPASFAANTGNDQDAWQHLREEIREGWNRSRGM